MYFLILIGTQTGITGSIAAFSTAGARGHDIPRFFQSNDPENARNDATINFNNVLKWDNSGYRIVGALVVPITNQAEIQTVEQAQTTGYGSVNKHIEKATQLFAQRPIPDFENSIKESISAVEAMCCIIANAKKATLGDALKKREHRQMHFRNIKPRPYCEKIECTESKHHFKRDIFRWVSIQRLFLFA